MSTVTEAVPTSVPIADLVVRDGMRVVGQGYVEDADDGLVMWVGPPWMSMDFFQRSHNGDVPLTLTDPELIASGWGTVRGVWADGGIIDATFTTGRKPLVEVHLGDPKLPRGDVDQEVAVTSVASDLAGDTLIGSGGEPEGDVMHLSRVTSPLAKWCATYTGRRLRIAIGVTPDFDYVPHD